MPVKYLEYTAHFVCVMWMFLSVLAIVFTVSWLWKVPMFLVLIGLVVLYVAMVRRGHAMANDPTEPLEWYQAPFWLGLLRAARALKWSGYDPSISTRHVIDCRHDPIDDDQLKALNGLTECEVLDLEGCPITDQSLSTIVKLKQLDCLVLVDTDVSQKGVHALQRRAPKLWVWY